jgi:hypothetical protein
MEVISLLGSAMGLGFVSGLNLYATVLTVGLGVRFGLITLNPELAQLEVLGSPFILATAGVIFLLEFFADKIPWVDRLVLKVNGKQQQYLFFKDKANRGERLFHILRIQRRFGS